MVKIVEVGGEHKKRFYDILNKGAIVEFGDRSGSLYVIGDKEEETDDAILIGAEWIPKNCIIDIRDVPDEEFWEIMHESSTMEEIIRKLGLNRVNTVNIGDPETHYAYKVVRHD